MASLAEYAGRKVRKQFNVGNGREKTYEGVVSFLGERHRWVLGFPRLLRNPSCACKVQAVNSEDARVTPPRTLSQYELI